MRLKNKYFANDGSGHVTLIPEYEEDLWYLYNLIHVGDVIKCKSHRKVQQANAHIVKTERKLIYIQQLITKIDYFQNEEISMVFKGKQMVQSDYINKGQFHSIKVEYNQPLRIIKQSWDKYLKELVKECTDQQHNTDVVAMVMEEGIAHLCFISPNTTFIKHKVLHTISKKNNYNNTYDKQLATFYEAYISAMKCFIIASPGFVKDQFFDHLKQHYQKNGYRNTFKNVLLVHTSSGYKDALLEACADAQVQKMLCNTKALQQVNTLNKFYKTMAMDMDRVAYGGKYVVEANEHHAIHTLLISDKLFRHKNFEQRKLFIQLKESVEVNGGEVVVFSSIHPSGEQLNNLGGLASLLRYPLNMDYLDKDEEEHLSSDDDDDASVDLDVDKYQKMLQNTYMADDDGEGEGEGEGDQPQLHS